MTDEIDRAQERAEIFRADAVASALRAARRAGRPDADGRCRDCGEDIPPERTHATEGRATLCVTCQEDTETQRRNG